MRPIMCSDRVDASSLSAVLLPPCGYIMPLPPPVFSTGSFAVARGGAQQAPLSEEGTTV